MNFDEKERGNGEQTSPTATAYQANDVRESPNTRSGFKGDLRISKRVKPDEPWPEPVDGKTLLDDLVAVVNRHLVVPAWAAEALALWMVHTYAFQLRDMAVYIGIESPEKRCGKTTLLTLLGEVSTRPIVAANITPPSVYRVIQEKAPSLLIDEADTVLHRNRELQGILNAGCTRKSAFVYRTVRDRQAKAEQRDAEDEEAEFDAEEDLLEGKERGVRLVRFSCWCPKAIARIGHLPDTLADRCVVITMQRKPEEVQCERLRNLDATDLRRRCARFVKDRVEAIASARPELPRELNDRAADIWEPLLVVADLAGSDWPEKARKAAVALSVSAQDESPIACLLLDLLIVFAEAEFRAGDQAVSGSKISSRYVVEALNARQDRPWRALLHGKTVTDMWLAQQLRPYGVRPKALWIQGATTRGYVPEDFHEIFRRYVPKSMYVAYREELLASFPTEEEKQAAEAAAAAEQAAKEEENKKAQRQDEAMRIMLEQIAELKKKFVK